MPPFQRQRAFIVDLRLLEICCQLAEVEHASVKLVKERSHVVCNKPTPAASTTCVGTVSRQVQKQTNSQSTVQKQQMQYVTKRYETLVLYIYN